MCSFKRKIHNWFKKNEIDGRSSRGSVVFQEEVIKKQQSILSCKHSGKDGFMEEKLKVGELLDKQYFKEKRRAAERKLRN